MAVLHGDGGRSGGRDGGDGVGGSYVCVCVELLRARSFGCKLFDGVSTDFIVPLGEGARG